MECENSIFAQEASEPTGWFTGFLAFSHHCKLNAGYKNAV